ncbi:MAG: hypothetical protein JWP38_912 [Herbaspirillum sp.]|nr:hypothetical protein [Herbaspirillum sp.]
MKKGTPKQVAAQPLMTVAPKEQVSMNTLTPRERQIVAFFRKSNSKTQEFLFNASERLAFRDMQESALQMKSHLKLVSGSAR